ncbi:formate dehydrogenase accessory sulfurtransferase FdhD [Alsobacter sp. SYSU M60028]|uniref:Sulfur carrier protein FdhD n=1 Tax=Alsobacter ponti TaxID=2962936 RepID=A0ABT1L9V1_9HYPH|nr:formate dehydrogenase accessory sulfurtransferase FdhD [Alsobacter ponti]
MTGITDIDGGRDGDEPEPSATPPSPSVEAGAVVVTRGGAVEPASRVLAAETPVSVTYNGIAYAVMMASPCDIEDFVTGFSLTEQVVAEAAEIESIDVRALERGLLAQARIPAARGRGLVENRRNLVGQTGCGICGIVELDQAVRSYGVNATRPAMDADAVFAALRALAPRQALNAETGATHAAAFADAEGRLLAVREDVGRHNALDKLIGHLARTGISPAGGFVVMTSRLSFELVQKCLATGVTALVGISAPTELAVRLAREHGLTLVGLAREDSFQVLSDPFDLWRASAGGG